MRKPPVFFEHRIAACLSEHGALSFTDLRRATDARSDQYLSRTLARMRRDGRIVRHVHRTTPPTTSYSLSERNGVRD
jgi:DNA-binding HxlR family transcriptional regulator